MGGNEARARVRVRVCVSGSERAGETVLNYASAEQNSISIDCSLFYTHAHTCIRIHVYYCLTSAAQWRKLMGDKRFLNEKLIGSLLENILINITII